MNYSKSEWKILPVTIREWDTEIKHYYITGTINGISERTIADVGEWKDRPNAKDDANLISSAPELYEALKNLVIRELIKDPNGDHYSEVLDVLAKAEGRE